MADLKSNDSDPWRGKYYDTLGELEKKETEWRQLEELLRQIAQRLSLLAEQGDVELDKDLESLRTALRRSAKPTELARFLDPITGGATRLEALRQRNREHTVTLVRRIAVTIIDRTLAPVAEQEAKILRARAGLAKETEFDALAGELSAAISDHIQPGVIPVHDLLRQFIEYLSFPAELQNEAESVKAELASFISPDAVGRYLRKIADLVAVQRSGVMREKQELEEFLRQLTSSLQDLDKNLYVAVTDQLTSLSEGRKFGLAVNEQMHNLQVSVEAADELQSLKSDIQTRITAIRGHMETFRQVEEEGNRRAEQNVAQLKNRLHELESETEGLRERLRQERSQALLDPLTGIFNRMAYDERLEQEYLRWKRYRKPLALTVWDVDRFKGINDRYGHQAGDKVLRVVAKLLTRGFRETDFVCRYGGEEFVVLLPETPLAHAVAVSEQLRANLEAAEFHYRGEQVRITLSCGLAEFVEGDSPDTAFSRADKALYRAKEGGRNRCCVG